MTLTGNTTHETSNILGIVTTPPGGGFASGGASLMMAAFGLCTASTQLHAVSYSDLTLVLSEDGARHSAQLTLTTRGDLLKFELPANDGTPDVQFHGAQKDAVEAAFRNNSKQVGIINGTVIVRYNASFADTVRLNDSGIFELRATSLPTTLQAPPDAPDHITMTWRFADNFEVIAYSNEKLPAESDVRVAWKLDGQQLQFRQTGGKAIELAISFAHRTSLPPAADDMAEAGPTDGASATVEPDGDGDGVPDYRDICIDQRAIGPSLLGCADVAEITLNDVRFASGENYLDISARNRLDHVASALLANQSLTFEVAAHTDSAGAAAWNLELSKRRAEAVRHYLMLRGVSANQVQATGFGETIPIADNTTLSGRLANRRIELRIMGDQ